MEGQADLKIEKTVVNESDSVSEEVDSEMCYYNKIEGVWKIFKDGDWHSSENKPSIEELIAVEAEKPPALTEEEINKKEKKK